MQRVLGNILCDLEFQVKCQIMNSLVNTYSRYPMDVATVSHEGAEVT